ncbi:conserved CBS domain protein [Leishmania major strain Friedlin]|uniref:Conserved CBS domain protein n=1 Tax=Leishmania major TaxID=5664 RepID=E9AEQ1_LEIMA|nr:conserved CBS domain protein [Leishmania major strain Friedlin]CAG9582427.1 AMP-activated_protein_kinase_-_gamma_regulatory_subunit [Leishmania major strain Friedlin]CBZ12704.1 conserved CBS domain protein [Leishmania major strain Friedlin]|eukprot:XP_003722471.1 conserved CBS domain protein [Leishmania major strain Friedlin]
MSASEVQHSYYPASAAHTSYQAGSSLLEAGYRPTDEECATLAAPIASFLRNCSCYDMLGVSTQVVVLDVQAPLSVAFIAAQETRIQSCVLWDPRKRQYIGVLTSTDYICILMYCQAHPKEADAVALWTIEHWQEVRAAQGLGRPKEKLGAPPGPKSSIVTCKTDTSLHDCLQMMREHCVRRIIALAEKEGEDFSLVAMMDVEQIVEYLGVMFFHIEKAGGSIGRTGGGANSSTGDAAGDGAGGAGAPHRTNLTISTATNRTNVAGDSDLSSLQHNNSHQLRSNDFDEYDDDPQGVFALGEAYVLPPYVASIITQAEAAGASGSGGVGIASDVRVGPYSSIFDVPFMYVPQVGAHRRKPIFATMEQKLSEALTLMLDHNTESIAVCSPKEGVIIDVVSRSDLLRMENQGVYDTQLTVREALASKISDHIFVFYEKDTLREIFSHFVRRRVKELFMVDPDTGRLLGQLNVAEFVYFLVFGVSD